MAIWALVQKKSYWMVDCFPYWRHQSPISSRYTNEVNQWRRACFSFQFVGLRIDVHEKSSSKYVVDQNFINMLFNIDQLKGRNDPIKISHYALMLMSFRNEWSWQIENQTGYSRWSWTTSEKSISYSSIAFQAKKIQESRFRLVTMYVLASKQWYHWNLSWSLLVSTSTCSTNSDHSNDLHNVDPNVLYPPFYIPPPGYIPRSADSDISVDDEPFCVNGMPPNYRGKFHLSLRFIFMAFEHCRVAKHQFFNVQQLHPTIA